MSKGIRVICLAFRFQWSVCLKALFELVYEWLRSTWRKKSSESLQSDIHRPPGLLNDSN
jgi:hypothetical protein